MINHLVCNADMDIFETRRIRLQHLIDSLYGGNQARFARETNIKAPQINRWLSKTASDRRNIKEISARAIEEKCGLIPRWLDEADLEISRKSAEILATEPSAAVYVHQLKPKSKRDQQIENIIALLNRMDDAGLAIAEYEAEKIAERYPAAKQTPMSS